MEAEKKTYHQRADYPQSGNAAYDCQRSFKGLRISEKDAYSHLPSIQKASRTRETDQNNAMLLSKLRL